MRLLRSAGGVGVSTNTLGKCGAGAIARELFPRRHSLGMPEGLGGRKPNSHIIGRAGRKEDSSFRTSTSVNAGARPALDGPNARQYSYFSAFSIAASAIGAMILNPAAFGCSPSSARSFFMSPLSSTMALK